MGKTAHVAALVLLGLGGSASASPPVDEESALSRSLGLEETGGVLYYTHFVSGAMVRTPLSAEQADRIRSFLEQLQASSSTVESVLSRTALERLRQSGIEPGAAAPDGTAWFAPTFGRYELTDAGRRAVPGILLDSMTEGAAPSQAGPTAPPAPGPSELNDPNFDGMFPRKGEVPASGEDAAAPLERAAPLGPVLTGIKEPRLGAEAPADRVRILADVPPPHEHTTLEKAAFWSTWGAYQATWAADLATTGMALNLPQGRESDPAYTLFGAKNKMGVLGSIAVMHAVVSVASWVGYEEAKNTRGLWRAALDLASVGANSAFTYAHAKGAIGNAVILERSKD